VSGVDGGGYNTKHVAKYFKMFFTANGQLHFDGVINLKGARTRAKRKKRYKQELGMSRCRKQAKDKPTGYGTK